MIKRLSFVAVATLAAMVIAPAHAGVVTYDAAGDFYLTEAPPAAPDLGSAWSYGYRSTALGTDLTAFPTHDEYPGESWFEGHHSQVGGTGMVPAYVMQNTGTTSESLGTTIAAIAPGALVLHPGDGTFAVVRWTAPTAGTIDAIAQFVRLDSTAGHTSDAFVVTPTFDLAPFAPLEGPGDDWGARLKSLSIEAGDFIDFVVGADGGYTSDATQLDASIRFSAVPEPATLASMCMALCTFGLITFVRRRRQKA